ncbi:MAG: hypothetical protein V9G14_05605 [Cypionkella sp.]
MINDKVGVMMVAKDGAARLVREGNYWHAAARPDGRVLVLDDMQGRLWLCETATGNVRLLATGIPRHGARPRPRVVRSPRRLRPIPHGSNSRDGGPH